MSLNDYPVKPANASELRAAWQRLSSAYLISDPNVEESEYADALGECADALANGAGQLWHLVMQSRLKLRSEAAQKAIKRCWREYCEL